MGAVRGRGLQKPTAAKRVVSIPCEWPGRSQNGKFMRRQPMTEEITKMPHLKAGSGKQKKSMMKGKRHRYRGTSSTSVY